MKKNPVSRPRNAFTRDGGFTLIEVLAVMVVVALLTGIAVIGASTGRERAAFTSMKTDAKNVIHGAEAVAGDTGGYVDASGDPLDASWANSENELSAQNSVSEFSSSEQGVNFLVASSKTDRVVTVVNSRIVAGLPEQDIGASDSATQIRQAQCNADGKYTLFEPAAMYVEFSPSDPIGSAVYKPCPGWEGRVVPGSLKTGNWTWVGEGADPIAHHSSQYSRMMALIEWGSNLED